MGISRDLTGTPWHVEKLTRSDGDEKRHKVRCYYHRKQGDRCLKYYEKCRGSAHCDYYIEDSPTSENNTTENKKTENNNLEAEPILPVGCIIRHNKFGKGIVTSYTNDTIAVTFNNGIEKQFLLNVLLKNKLITKE